jgi:hypothetical protein
MVGTGFQVREDETSDGFGVTLQDFIKVSQVISGD